MKKLWALVAVRNKEFYRDKFTLMWTFLFPFLVMLGFAYGISGKQEPLLKIGFLPESSMQNPALKELVSMPLLQPVGYEDEAQAQKRIERHQLDLLVRAEGNGVTYWINAESPKAAFAERILKTNLSGTTRVDRKELVGKKIRYVDWLVPGLVGMNLMFASLFGVGYVIVRYRKNGVLKRLRATPLRAIEFLFAQVVSRTLLLVVTTAMTIAGAYLFIGFRMAGSWLDLFAFIAVGSGSLIALGMMVAARISSEEVADGVLNLMTWPMMFLSGVWFSLEGASPWVAKFSKLLPLTHIVNGMRAIMLDGAPLRSLAPEMGMLALAGIILLTIGSVLFKWR